MGAASTGWAPVRAAMDEAAEAATVDRVVLGPAPCSTCGAWIEWLGVGPWVALGTTEAHDCSAYLRAAADMAAYPQRWVSYPEPEPVPWLTWRLVLGLGLVAVFFALALARWQAGLL